MYQAFYALRELPFHVTADPAFLFPSRQHRDTLEHLAYGIRQRLGFLVVTGEVGCGKTTVIKALLAELPADAVRTSVLLNPAFSDVQLLEAIIQDFGLTPGRKTRAGLMDALNRFLLEQQAHGRTAALVVDEAQTLAPRTLEQIRLLSNLETAKEKLLQIVLAGQPELDLQLTDPRLRPLRQRVAIRCRIEPLAENEIGAYIAHRLRVAGAAPDRPRFTPEAVALIARYSRGLPRAINHVCENALLAGFVQDAMTIDDRLIHHAIDTLDGASQPTEVLDERDHGRVAESAVPVLP